jgi:GT2 family glycosyltransferase
VAAKQYINRAARKSVEEYFTRKGESVKLSVARDHWRIHRTLPNPAPLVTLIIPTRNRHELLVKCIASILDKTSYANFEILIADNDSDDPGLKAYYKKMERRGRFTVLPCPGPFNYSTINNRAVEHANGEIIGLLNNDLEALNSDWLDEMVCHAVRSEIGVVGAKLYFPDRTVQHAGIITGIGGVAGHPFKHFPQSDQGTPQYRPHLVHNVSAVTAACAVVRKSVFNEAGGFDETNLPIAFNDVDFCLRVEALGYRNLFTPFAEFIHHESASRGAEDSPDKVARFHTEIVFMKQRWGDRLINDPAYNPNLSLETEDFSFASPPRVPPLV